MSALLTPPARRFGGPEFDDGPSRDDDAPTLDDSQFRDDAPTLDDVISRAWEVLRADVPAACPVCGGELVPRASAGAGIVGGRCESCGSALS